MSLRKYLSKRTLEESHEPTGKKQSAKHPTTLNFCVQKHDASHLHYDFRLEYKGVLLSWAVPKGPSMNPEDKRLAIQVEDHPLDYQYFEGIIPKGNYGAGTVEIWDHGTYNISETKSSQDIGKEMALGLKNGHIDIVLHGKKLKGRFVLQKFKKDAEDHSWLLIKVGDDKISSEHHSDEPEVKKKASK